MHNPVYVIDSEKLKYPSCIYADSLHARYGVVSPTLLSTLKHGGNGKEALMQYHEAEAERLKQKVNDRTCTRGEWKALNALEDEAKVYHSISMISKLGANLSMQSMISKTAAKAAEELTANPYRIAWVGIDLAAGQDVTSYRTSSGIAIPLFQPRTCRICGCDDAHACPGGCYWVEDDLCSRCAEIEDLIDAYYMMNRPDPQRRDMTQQYIQTHRQNLDKQLACFKESATFTKRLSWWRRLKSEFLRFAEWLVESASGPAQLQ